MSRSQNHAYGTGGFEKKSNSVPGLGTVAVAAGAASATLPPLQRFLSAICAGCAVLAAQAHGLVGALLAQHSPSTIGLLLLDGRSSSR